jgi:hypothetical protein
MVTNVIVQYASLKHSDLVFSKVAYPVCAYFTVRDFLDKATVSLLLVRMNPRDILAYLMFVHP